MDSRPVSEEHRFQDVLVGDIREVFGAEGMGAFLGDRKQFVRNAVFDSEPVKTYECGSYVLSGLGEGENPGSWVLHMLEPVQDFSGNPRQDSIAVLDGTKGMNQGFSSRVREWGPETGDISEVVEGRPGDGFDVRVWSPKLCISCDGVIEQLSVWRRRSLTFWSTGFGVTTCLCCGPTFHLISNLFFICVMLKMCWSELAAHALRHYCDQTCLPAPAPTFQPLQLHGNQSMPFFNAYLPISA